MTAGILNRVTARHHADCDLYAVSYHYLPCGHIMGNMLQKTMTLAESIQLGLRDCPYCAHNAAAPAFGRSGPPKKRKP